MTMGIGASLGNKYAQNQRFSQLVNPDRIVYGNVRFGDPQWFMDEQSNVWSERKSYRIKWDKINKENGTPNNIGMLISIQEYVFFRIADPIPKDEPVVAITAKTNAEALIKFMHWLNDNGMQSFASVSESDLMAYINHVRVQTMNGEMAQTTAALAMRSIYSYQQYKNRVSDPLNTALTNYKIKRVGFKRAASFDNSECKTPVIPDEVINPLIKNCVKMLDQESESILGAFDTIVQIKKKYYALDNNIGVRQKQKILIKAMTDAIKSKYGFNSLMEYNRHEIALKNSCIVIMLYLSGVRISELLSLEFGCVYIDKSSDGVLDQYYMTGKLLKKHKKDVKWVIIEPVYRAIKTIEKLNSHYREVFMTDKLFYTSSHTARSSTGGSTNLNTLREDLSYKENASSSSVLLKFSSLMTFFNAREGFEDIPQVDGRVWNFTSRQFRRTLARHIAREPFGIIAGALQYKHAKTAIFESYAGTDPIWSTLLKSEETLASIDFLDELYHDIEEGGVAGIKGKQLANDFEFKGKAGDRRKDHLKYWIDSVRGDFHVGPLNYCFFDPATAICVNSPTSKTPVFSKCRPDKCANSCVSNKHLPVWENQADEISKFLRDKSLSEPQRVALESEYASVVKIITSVKGGDDEAKH